VQRHAFDHLDAPVIRVTQADTPLPFAPNLIDESLPSVKRVVEAVKR
jgi:pyruvate dehydrogenase E1 component beta subunit